MTIKRVKGIFIASLIIIAILSCVNYKCVQVCAYSDMPFYNLSPKELTLRSKFFTSYASSSEERKWNIWLASTAINNFFLDVNAEFSFNDTVGMRTEKRGYKTAKIIVNGEFVDGIGGGVCQVSTTLYNAVILAGLKVTEYHPHSLPVSYVAPSFDAMVNSNSADFKFVNNTGNPIIINAVANGSTLTINITGEKLNGVYVRESVIVEEINAPTETHVLDEKGEYPDLYEGESKVISYSKKGYKSEGYLSYQVNGRTIERKKLRSDCYSAKRGLVVEGTAKREETDEKKLFDWFFNNFLQI